MDQTVQNIPIKISPLKNDAPGFLPRWRNLLAAKRAVMDMERAQPEDIDKAIDLLCEHITAPADRASKVAILNQINGEEFSKLFEAIMRTEAVPPSNGAPSDT